jgi:hypothetical protein
MENLKHLEEGLITLEGDIANEGTWQYIENQIITRSEGKGWLPLNDGRRGKVSITIEMAFSPEKLPFTISRDNTFDWRIPKENLAQITAMMDGVGSILTHLLKDAWLLIGHIEGAKPISIIHFKTTQTTFYKVLSINEKKAIDNNRHLLN